MASYADLEDLFQENQAATAYNLPGRNRVNPELRQATQDAEEERTRPAPDQSQLEGRSSEEDEVNSSETQTAPADVPQQGQDRGTTAPQSGLMRITHGDQSYLADPMSGQNYSAPGQPFQQQQAQQQGAPISPEMRAAWPYLNNQQRAAMLQHREQTQNQSWLNQQKLTQAEKMRKAKLEQQKSAIMNGPYSDNEKAEYTKLLDIPLEVLNKKEAQEKIAIKQQQRKELEDELAFRKAVELNGGNLDAKTMPHRTYNVEDAQGNKHTYMITPKGHIPVGEGKGSHAAEGAGTGKGHDPLASSVTANTSTKEGTKSINWEGVDKDRAELKKRQQQEEEDKLPGVRDDKGARGTIREAAKKASAAGAKDVVKNLATIDRLAQTPDAAMTGDRKAVLANLYAKVAPYLPQKPAEKSGTPETVEERPRSGEQAGASPSEDFGELPIDATARKIQDWNQTIRSMGSFETRSRAANEKKAVIKEYASRKGISEDAAEKELDRLPATREAEKKRQARLHAERLAREGAAGQEKARQEQQKRAAQDAKTAVDAILGGQ